MNDLIEIVKFSEYHYEGFILSLKTTSSCYVIVECKELDIYYKTFGRIDYIISEFKKAVDKKLDNKTMMKITSTYKGYSVEITRQCSSETKEDDSQYFRCILTGDVYSSPIKISNESLERVLHWHKGHVDKFNIANSNHLMNLVVEYKGQTLTIDSYDPYINQVSKYKCDTNFIPRIGTCSSLNSLVEQFQQWIDKQLNQNKSNMNDVIKMGDSSEWYYEGFILHLKHSIDYRMCIAECKETGFYYMSSAGIDHIMNEFKKAVDTRLKNDKEKDEDLVMAEDFIYALTKINKDIEKLKDNSNYSLVLDIKLGKLYEKAKDILHLTSFDSFKTFYFMRFSNK